MRRIRKHLSFANVIAVIALFVALGGGAYAAGLITGKQIKNNSIKGKDVKESSLVGVDKCPANAPNKVAGLCYTASQTATTWDGAAQAGCPPLKLRLPTIGEALLVMNAVGGGATNETWTDEIADLTATSRGLVKAPGDPMGQIFSAAPGSAHTYRCITTATN